jgi:hypothetical protein
MNSREQIGAARTEAWAHNFSTSLVNNPADANANFGYYKRLYDPQAPGNHILYPPFSVDALVTWEWMEAYCNAANAGTEMDWMGFFYQLDNKTANAWSIGNFTSVFATECGTPPFSNCSVSYTTLQNAANTVFGLNTPKALYMSATADGNGINH